MYQIQRNFYHVNVRNNHFLIESYCLVCHKFVAASSSESNLSLSEIVHRSTCRLNYEKAKPDRAGKRLA